jgi:hypothetical protein
MTSCSASAASNSGSSCQVPARSPDPAGAPEYRPDPPRVPVRGWQFHSSSSAPDERAPAALGPAPEECSAAYIACVEYRHSLQLKQATLQATSRPPPPLPRRPRSGRRRRARRRDRPPRQQRMRISAPPPVKSGKVSIDTPAQDLTEPEPVPDFDFDQSAGA